MGDLIKKEEKNKFDSAVERLNEIEDEASEKNNKVMKAITGNEKKEKRKSFPVYLPASILEQFQAINKAYGISNSAAINMLVRDYVTEKKKVLDEI